MKERVGGPQHIPVRGGLQGLARQVLKKIVRLASAFPSPPFRSSDFAGPRRPRLYGFHTHSRTSGAFRIARGAGGEAVDVNGNLVEREKHHLSLYLNLHLGAGCAPSCWPIFG